MKKAGRTLIWKLQLTGWLLFVVCAILFIAASYKSGDYLSLAGSLVFLLACFFFLIPMFSAPPRDD